MKNAIIIRGLPGAGKTTLGERVAKILGCECRDVDKYRVVDGKYFFDHEKINQNHKSCFNDWLDDLTLNNNAVVANSFISEMSMWNYISMAVDYGAKIWIVQFDKNRNFGSIHTTDSEAMSCVRDAYTLFDGDSRWAFEIPESQLELKTVCVDDVDTINSTDEDLIKNLFPGIKYG